VLLSGLGTVGAVSGEVTGAIGEPRTGLRIAAAELL
jgi:hypothetical protein